MARFSMVSGFCALLDTGTGIILLQFHQFPIYLCSFMGWLFGLISGYLLHLRLTFVSKGIYHSNARAFLYFCNCLFLLIIRYLSIWAAEGIISMPEVVLVISVLFSFIVNYFISKCIVFKVSTASTL
jgi:putative flippase GtrA